MHDGSEKRRYEEALFQAVKARTHLERALDACRDHNGALVESDRVTYRTLRESYAAQLKVIQQMIANKALIEARQRFQDVLGSILMGAVHVPQQAETPEQTIDEA